jgi:signal transduction histidine kinase
MLTVLRRKLILNLAPMILLLLLSIVAAMVLLERVLNQFDHADAETLKGVASNFRWLLIGLGVWFLLVINVCVLMLIRMSSMILRPVDALTKATRELAQERFGHRVQIEENDEFDELAQAYNTLAEHLAQTEKRRIETLGQVAIAINHELNNAMASIELQLGMLGRNSSDPHSERRLRTIQQSLARMKDAVQSLKSVRRIVLTDYSPGMKMLDLERSVLPDQPVQAQGSH